MLERIVNFTQGESFDAQLAVLVTRISASVIVGSYLLLYIFLPSEEGMVKDPKILWDHLLNLSHLFNSITIISLFTLVSFTAMIPGLAATFFGLLRLKTRKGQKYLVWGLIGFCVGTINFYILLKNCTPS